MILEVLEEAFQEVREAMIYLDQRQLGLGEDLFAGW
jgi:hypothetical protein